MGIYFGTDGIRGIVNNDLTDLIAQMVGNALSRKKKNAKIVLGRDTRISGSYLSAAFACGALKGGANVEDVGIVPTAGISFLVKKRKADYGVMISASHNSKEYNGIKIFDSTGRKLSEKEELELERLFACQNIVSSTKVGKYKFMPSLCTQYSKFLLDSVEGNFDQMKIVLDLANGAAYKIAPKVFRKKGANIIKTNFASTGKNINEKCGSTFVLPLQEKVKSEKADIGFAFDGDSDRVIAVDEKGEVIDGDKLIYVLAKKLHSEGKLKENTIVGTSHTNSGLAQKLAEEGIKLVRTDIGDKYVIEEMQRGDFSLGGEQSGHIILKDFLPTGDGILAALQIAKALKDSGEKASKLSEVKLFCQLNKNIVVSDKLKIVNNEILSKKISRLLSEITPKGRVFVRASGTEPKIRIMVEHENQEIAKKCLDELVKTIQSI